MPVNTVDPKLNLVVNNNRGPSDVIWADCPIFDFIENPSKGMYFFDDFIMAGNAVMSSAYKNSIGAWTVYADAGGTLNDGALEGGVLKISSGTDLDQDVFFSTAGSFRILTTSTLALNKKLWFEASVGRSSVATDILESFVGLADGQLASNIPAVNRLFSGTDDTLAVATANFIGFHNRGDTATVNGSEWSFVFGLAGGTAVYSAGLTTLLKTVLGASGVANTLYKFGFVFDPNAYPVQISSAGDLQTVGVVAKPLITIYVNGLPAATFLTNLNLAATASHAFPTGFMSPIFGCAQHATKGSFLIDWIRVAQLANS